jgi:hypothetical protein
LVAIAIASVIGFYVINKIDQNKKEEAEKEKLKRIYGGR